jgi:hypothetical protein
MPEWVTLAAVAGVLLLALWLATTNYRLNRMIRHYRGLAAGIEGQPLDQILERMVQRGDARADQIAAVANRVEELAVNAEVHLQRVGMVRYNAFDDTGGDQSFALALLDIHGDGAILNGLFHRNECRVYAKPVRAWKSTYSLSDEEQEAVRKAREND